MRFEKLRTKATVPLDLQERASMLVVYLKRFDRRWSMSRLVVLGLLLACKELAPKKRNGQMVLNQSRCNELMEKVLKQS